MKTIIVTGLIGAGKSSVSAILKERGIPVYDCDSAVKGLYARRQDLADMLSDDIFTNQEKLSALENALFPVLMEDFAKWAETQGRDFVAMESATILQKGFFDGFGDYVLLVTAPEQTRIDRVMSRGGISKESLLQRMSLQKDQSGNPRISFIIDNSSSVEQLGEQVDIFLKSINYGKRKN